MGRTAKFNYVHHDFADKNVVGSFRVFRKYTVSKLNLVSCGPFLKKNCSIFRTSLHYVNATLKWTKIFISRVEFICIKFLALGFWNDYKQNVLDFIEFHKKITVFWSGKYTRGYGVVFIASPKLRFGPWISFWFLKDWNRWPWIQFRSEALVALHCKRPKKVLKFVNFDVSIWAHLEQI